MAESGVYAADPAGQLPPPLSADDAAAASWEAATAELQPPADLQPQQAKEPQPRLASQPLVLIPLCRKGDRAGIERQLQAGFSVEETDIEGNTPLHVAVEAPRNEIATVQTLLENGANVNAANYLGAAPLHYVCLRRSNHRGIANILLENGAEIDSPTLARKTPLHFACEQQLPELAEILCLFGANPTLTDVEGNNPLHLALAKAGGRDTVKRQIAEKLFASNAALLEQNLQGLSPVHLACRSGYVRCLVFFHEHQADMGLPTSTGESGLHLACQSNHGEVTQFLLVVAPQLLNQADMDGNTPLHICASLGSLDSAVLLLKQGADTNLKNNEKKSAFDISKTKGTDLSSTHNPELVQLLKDAQKSGACRQS